VAGAVVSVCLSVAGLQVFCCVCAVVSLCALVCVAVMAALGVCALWCCLCRCVAGFALCGAAGVRCECAVGVRLYAALCAVCVIWINKINDLGGNLNEFDYMRIILGLYRDYIIYYLSPPLGDYLDNVDAFFRPKKGSPPYLGTLPPQKI